MRDKIKVVEGLLPWQVMKRADEGESVARRKHVDTGTLLHVWRSCLGEFNWLACEYAIIDTSSPVIDFDGFNWDFFATYGGLHLKSPEGRLIIVESNLVNDGDVLVESPLYPWTGGECPVTGTIEVTVINRNGFEFTRRADECNWEFEFSEPCLNGNDIIHFKITGNVL